MQVSHAMENTKLCRMCLITNVKMYLIHDSLEKNMLSLLGANLISFATISQYACFECAALMKKFQDFKEKCLVAQSMLYNIIFSLDTGQELEYQIKCVDRSLNRLESLLTKHLITEDNTIFIKHDHEEKLNFRDEKSNDNLENVLLVEPLDDEIKTEYKENIDEDNNVFDDCSDDDTPLETLKQLNKAMNQSNQSKSQREDRAVSTYVRDSEPEERQRPRRTKDVKLKIIKKKKNHLTPEEVSILEDFNIKILTIEEQEAEMEMRKESANYKELPFKCELCYRGFLIADTLKNHQIKHDPSSGEVVCPLCKFRFKKRFKYNIHADKHQRRYQCKICGFVASATCQAKKHRNWHEGVQYKCKYCSETFSKYTSQLSHVRIKHPSRFLCDLCGYSFVSALGVKHHKSRMHKEDIAATDKQADSGLHCAECEVTFRTGEAYRRHMVTSDRHHVRQGVGCRECGESFPSTSALRLHRTTVHDKYGLAKRVYVRARYDRERIRSQRERRQPDHYPHKCEHCEVMIVDRRNHWWHYQQTHKDRQYPLADNRMMCDVCGKGFRTNAYLTSHMRTHSGERPFRCPAPDCHKTFFKRVNLSYHLKVHSEQRVHTCSVCSKSFKTRHGLRQHSIKVHEPRRGPALEVVAPELAGTKHKQKPETVLISQS